MLRNKLAILAASSVLTLLVMTAPASSATVPEIANMMGRTSPASIGPGYILVGAAEDRGVLVLFVHTEDAAATSGLPPHELVASLGSFACGLWQEPVALDAAAPVVIQILDAQDRSVRRLEFSEMSCGSPPPPGSASAAPPSTGDQPLPPAGDLRSNPSGIVRPGQPGSGS